MVALRHPRNIEQQQDVSSPFLRRVRAVSLSTLLNFEMIRMPLINHAPISSSADLVPSFTFLF